MLARNGKAHQHAWKMLTLGHSIAKHPPAPVSCSTPATTLSPTPRDQKCATRSLATPHLYRQRTQLPAPVPPHAFSCSHHHQQQCLRNFSSGTRGIRTGSTSSSSHKSFRNAPKADHDPLLIRYMNQWIKRTFIHHHRCLYSTATMPNPAPTSNQSTKPIQVQEHKLRAELKFLQKQQQRAMNRASHTRSSTGRRAGLGSVQSSESSLSLLSTLSSNPDTKPLISPASSSARQTADRVWRKYLDVLQEGGQMAGHGKDSDIPISSLATGECLTMMRVMQDSADPQSAAVRILQIAKEMEVRKLPMSPTAYELVLWAQIDLGDNMAVQATYDRIRDQFRGAQDNARKHLLAGIGEEYAQRGRVQDGIQFLQTVPFMQQETVGRLYQQLITAQLTLDGITPSTSSGQLIFDYFKTPFPRPSLLLHQLVHSLASATVATNSELESNHVVRTLSQSGLSIMLGRMRDTDGLSELIVGLLQTQQFEEVGRVLKEMSKSGLCAHGDMIRKEIESWVLPEMADRKLILNKWEMLCAEAATGSETLSLTTHSNTDDKYENINSFDMLNRRQTEKELARRLRSRDMKGALALAQRMAGENWKVQTMDFTLLNTFMVNSCDSRIYMDYLDIRFILGSPALPRYKDLQRLVWAACRRSDIKTAGDLLNFIRANQQQYKPEVSIYNAIISAAGANKRMKIARTVFDTLLWDGLEPDHETFHALLNAYGENGDLNGARAVAVLMSKHKVEPDTKTFNLVIKAYLRSRMDLSTSQRLFNTMQKIDGAQPDLVTFNQLLDGYRRAGDATKFDNFFKRYFQEMSSSDVQSVSPWDGGTSAGQSEKTVAVRKSKTANELVVESPDDFTILTYLKQTLFNREVDKASVMQLWQKLTAQVLNPWQEAKRVELGTQEQDHDGTDAIDGRGDKVQVPLKPQQLQTLFDYDPATFVSIVKPNKGMEIGVPVQGRLGSDRFVYTTIRLFRQAMEMRSDVEGLQLVDKAFCKYFPRDPLAQGSWSDRLGMFAKERDQNLVEKLTKEKRKKLTSDKLRKEKEERKAYVPKWRKRSLSSSSTQSPQRR